MKYEKPQHDECKMIIYLANEIIKEIDYNQLYKLEQQLAEKKAEKNGGYWWEYMNIKVFDHEPRKSVIEDNKKMIRRLALKISSEV